MAKNVIDVFRIMKRKEHTRERFALQIWKNCGHGQGKYRPKFYSPRLGHHDRFFKFDRRRRREGLHTEVRLIGQPFLELTVQMICHRVKAVALYPAFAIKVIQLHISCAGIKRRHPACGFDEPKDRPKGLLPPRINADRRHGPLLTPRSGGGVKGQLTQPVKIIL